MRRALALLFCLALLAVPTAVGARPLPPVPVTAAVGDPGDSLVYTPISPCRVADTRFATLGKMGADETRSFLVAGTTGFSDQGGATGGCGIPQGAASVSFSITAVQPDGAGFLRMWAWDDPLPAEPNATVLNYSKDSSLHPTNGTPVPD